MNFFEQINPTIARTEDAVQIIPGQTEAKVYVLLMASIHVVLPVAGAEIPWNTVKHFSTEISAEVIAKCDYPCLCVPKITIP